MSLYYLKEADFELHEEAKGPVLCIRGATGYSLVLFYSPKCAHSKKILPVFKKLPGAVGGCSFSLLNVSQNKEVVRRSRSTSTPIRYVPYVVLHLAGRPFMRYDGPAELEAMKRFVLEISMKLTKNQGGTPGRTLPGKAEAMARQEQEKAKEIPPFTIGRPKNSGELNPSGYGSFHQVYGQGMVAGDGRP